MNPVEDGDKVDRSEVKRTVASFMPGADILLFTGGIMYGALSKLQDVLRALENNGNEDIYVLIGTSGGNPHEAFQMMQLLHCYYRHIYVVLLGGCYSAGTLFALGAHKIFMSHSANLGPLDIQMRREDDISRMSGECYRQALSDISMVAQRVFIDLFARLKSKRDMLISTQTASHAAGDIAKGLLAPITQQIEPTKLGEMMRSQRIGISYGIRLMRRSYDPNKARHIVETLARDYPSHDTIVDFEEADRIGLHVERIDPLKWQSGIFLGYEKMMLSQDYSDEPQIKILNEVAIAE